MNDFLITFSVRRLYEEQLNIGLLGMGVVGTGVCQLLAEQREQSQPELVSRFLLRKHWPLLMMIKAQLPKNTGLN